MSFGIYSRHIIHSEFNGESWSKPTLTTIKARPSDLTLFVGHYGQGGFEGMKAKKIKSPDGVERVLVFAIEKHFHRFNQTMKRVGITPVSKEMFYVGIERLINKIWDEIPSGENEFMYLRPLGRGTGTPMLEKRSPGLFGNRYFDFTIMASQLFTDHSIRMVGHLEQTFGRACKGGTGNVKAIGNYGAALGPEDLIHAESGNQILWTDRHDYTLQEFSTATCFIVRGNELLTPSLEQGTILPGITRDHILQIARRKKILKVVERTITVEEFIAWLEDQTIEEVFGAGSAVTIMSCSGIRVGEKLYKLPEKGTTSHASYLFSEMNAAYCGSHPEWVYIIERDKVPAPKPTN